MKFELHRIVIETRVFSSSLRLVADIDEWKAGHGEMRATVRDISVSARGT